MVYVHLSIKDIPASSDEVWDLIGINFVDIIEWSTQHIKCRTAKPSEIPLKWSKDKFKSKLHMPVPCLGRVVQYPAQSKEQKGELVQTLIEYDSDKKQLGYACAFPLPIVDAYFCTMYVVQRKDLKTHQLLSTSEVHMEIELYVLPGFCWLGELINLRGKLKSDKRGPCGELKDIKQYFVNKKKQQHDNESKIATKASSARNATGDGTETTNEESSKTSTTAAESTTNKETTAPTSSSTTNEDDDDNEVTIELSQGGTPSNPTVLHKHVNDRFF